MTFKKRVLKAQKGFIDLVKQVDAFLVPDYSHSISGAVGMGGINITLKRRKKK